MSGLVASDSTILRPLGGPSCAIAACGFAIWGSDHPVSNNRAWLGLRFSNRSGLRPAARWICGHEPKILIPIGIRLRFRCRLELRVRLRPNSIAICARAKKGRPLNIYSNVPVSLNLQEDSQNSAASLRQVLDLTLHAQIASDLKANPLAIWNRNLVAISWRSAISKHQRFPEWSWRSFRRNWRRTSGEVWKEIFELLLLGKSSETFSTKTPPPISPSNFTTRFWVVAGPRFLQIFKSLRFQ